MLDISEWAFIGFLLRLLILKSTTAHMSLQMELILIMP